MAYCHLDPPQQQDDSVKGIKCVRDIPHFVQLASPVLLPIRDTSEDHLKELDKKISPQLNLESKKLVKLLPFPPARD